MVTKAKKRKREPWPNRRQKNVLDKYGMTTADVANLFGIAHRSLMNSSARDRYLNAITAAMTLVEFQIKEKI